uniref:Uncharacterized protein n=1 Tax=Oryza sativa subsp. japonica TaxID=39947 RepID=Q6YU02_ORYSJ|nr:hypothetical protein [Oryza sativa Japonica Group]BAD17725.1 hypothetical protein [Oryza sativa Japonica Group]
MKVQAKVFYWMRSTVATERIRSFRNKAVQNKSMQVRGQARDAGGGAEEAVRPAKARAELE